MYGRDELEWEELKVAAIEFLREQARLQRLTSYTELNSVVARRTGHPAFDFTSDRDRAAVGHLLGECVDSTFAEVRAMISSIVIYLNANDAGPGFYRLAVEMGLLDARPSATTKDAFWSKQVRAVHDFYAHG